MATCWCGTLVMGLQARQQLLELQSVREELEARSKQLAGLKKAYELNKVGQRCCGTGGGWWA